MTVHIQTTGRTAPTGHRRPYETAATPDMTAARSFGALIVALAAYVLSVAQAKAEGEPSPSRPEPQPEVLDSGPGLSVTDITTPEIGDVVNALAAPARVYDGEPVDTRPLIAAHSFALPPLSAQMTEAVFTDADLVPDTDFL
jgi:hypothetical protein